MKGRRTIELAFAALILAAPVASGQDSPPLYLDVRPGEDPLLVDVTEMDGRYPRQAILAFEKAVEDARKGKRATATEHLEEAIRLAPDFFAAHLNLGVLYQKMARYRDAEREYGEAQRLNPRSAAPLVNLGSLHIEESVYGESGNAFDRRRMLNSALENLNAALAIQPSSPFGHYLTGVVYYLTGFYETAEEHLQRASKSAEAPFSRLALANVYVKMKEWGNVVLQLDAFLEENPFAANRSLVKELRQGAADKLKKR